MEGWNLPSWTPLAVAALACGVVTWRWYTSEAARAPDQPNRLGRQAPQCARSVWETVFFQGSVVEALNLYGRRRGRTVLMVIVEPQGGSGEMERWVWPDPAVRTMLSERVPDAAAAIPAGGDEEEAADSSLESITAQPLRVIALRLTEPASAEAQLFIRLQRDRNPKLPLFFFMWGPPSIMCFTASGSNMRGADIARIIQRIGTNQARTQLELGDTLPEVRRQQGDAFSASLSGLTAQNLVRAGVVTAADFVPDTNEEEEMARYGGLSEEELSMIAAAEDLSRQDSQDLRQQQEMEYAAALQADRELGEREAAERKKKEEEAAVERKAVEDEEAKVIWRKFEKEHKLENLPAPPADGEQGTLKLSIVTLGGERLGRLWRSTDTMSMLFDYVDGNMTKEEEDNILAADPDAAMPPAVVLMSNFPTRKFECGDKTLSEAGLETNMVLRVSDSV